MEKAGPSTPCTTFRSLRMTSFGEGGGVSVAQDDKFRGRARLFECDTTHGKQIRTCECANRRVRTGVGSYCDRVVSCSSAARVRNSWKTSLDMRRPRGVSLTAVS